jgi:amino acid adenylation domain-containing protein
MIDSGFILRLRNLGVVLRVEDGQLLCNAPKGVLTPDLVGEIKANKDAIIEILDGGGRAAQTAMPDLLRAADPENAPLTYAQQRLWFLNQLQPESTAYNMSWALALNGDVDVDALAESLNAAVRRHSILRVRIRKVDDGYVQSLLPSLKMELQCEQLEGSVGATDADLQRKLAQDADQPFDLSKGPLIRAKLIRMAPQKYIFFLVIHHIVFDGWSFDILMRDLFMSYKALHDGQTLVLPDLPIQYADFAVWQRAWLTEEEIAKQLAYWKQKLGDLNAPLALPLDKPRPRVQTFNGDQRMASLPASLAQSLRNMAKEENASLFMVLLAVFKLLIFRYTGQEDICIGSPFSGRQPKETEALVGFFVNTVVLRTDLSGSATFRQLLQRVRHVVLEAQVYQNVPFEKIVEELAPKRELGRTPIFQILFNHVTTQLSGNSDFLDIRVAPFGTYQGETQAKFDLTFYVEEFNDQIRTRLVFNTDLFSPERIVAMLEQYRGVLEQVVEKLDEPISSYSLIVPSHRERLPDLRAKISASWRGAVHEQFSKMAQDSPQRIAVVDKWGQWTYGALDRSSSQLAHRLLTGGIGSGDTVAVYGHRSAGMALALLGILKAGGAFVILDPHYPAQRLTAMLQAADPRGWIQLEAAGTMAEELQTYIADADFKCRVTLPPTPAEADKALEGAPTTAPKLPVSPEDKAYIIFTSGTTGRPKGIVGTHRPLSHFLQWHCTRFGFDDADRFSMLSGLGHDPLLRDIFTPLWTGARLCIPETEEMLMPQRLRAWMRAQQITVAHLTPALGDVLAEGADEELPTLQYFFFGGDALGRHTLKKIKGLASGARCVNFYGTTETPQAMGYHIIEPETEVSSLEHVPVGRGIDGAQLVVLNASGEAAGVGELGEVHVRTPYLSMGYLNDEVLTADKFIVNPFGETNQDRIYKTGDLGRYRPDGRLVLYGRGDDQVSIRGFRVELKEIEASLNEMHTVSDCVVILREDEGEERQLVAYYVLKPEHDGANLDIRGFVRSKLPDYMVPGHFVELSAIPLTPNGKVDYKVLPRPDTDSTLKQGYVAPRFSSELSLTEIWSTVLGIPQVGIHDNFFDLGGHSLLAVQVISRIGQVLDVDVALRDLFEHPTVAQLAEWIKDLSNQDGCMRLPQIRVVDRGQSLPLSFAQERLWFLQQLEPESTAYSMPGLYRLRGRLDLQSLRKSVDAMARRHETLRTTFGFFNELPVQVIAAEVELPIEVQDLRNLDEDKRESQAFQRAYAYSRRPFDLAAGPLFRIVVFQLADEDHIMLANMHHIISDFWSFGIMGREFSGLYSAYVKGQEPRLHDLSVQYADFACCQRNWLQGEVLETHLSYWKEKLGRELMVLELPMDRPRPAIQTHVGADSVLELKPELVDGLRHVARMAGASLFMLLLAAFKLLLYRLSGQTDIVVGSPVSGRNRIELEDLIGFFINTLVMRTDLSGNPAFDALLKRVRETALGAFAHQEMPFEKLVEVLAPQRDLSRTPLFQVFFNHIQVNENRNELPGLTVETTGAVERDAKFDLTLYVWEQSAGISLSALYNADLFSAARIAAMLEQYNVLLEQVATKPEREINNYSLLTEKDHDLLPDPSLALEKGWAGSVTQRLAHWAQVQPQTIALEDRWDIYSYGQIEQLSNRIAQRLSVSGIGAGDIVVVYGHRSAGLVLALLGILKAGAAFLVLDPNYPAGRLARMLEDASPKGLVALESDNVMGNLLNGRQFACQLILPRSKKQMQDLLAGDCDGPPAAALGPDQTAYIIFTSGSTGRPKGIVGTHRPLSHFVQWHCSRFGFDASDRFSMLSGLSHDPLLRDIFTPLWVGARLCIPESGEILMPQRLRAWMQARQITVAHLTPALGQVMAEGAQEGLSSIRYLFFGGDVLNRRTLDKIRVFAPEACCVNFYGATETPQAMGYHVIEFQEDSDKTGPIPVGRGIEGAQLIVLNASGQPAGVGELGEIHVRTPYLSQGYLNDAELTADKFIFNPFGISKHDKLYRTGDMGRYLPDGQIMFNGRRDSQVSIRGFRVELSEVQAVLLQCTGVHDCVVLAREQASEQCNIVAYVVMEQDQYLDSASMKRQLGNQLPDYMVPAAIMALAEIPLTPNGKIDYRRLDDVKRDPIEPSSIALPQTEMEICLADIWRKVLGLEVVGVNDNFFDLGGHSLLSIQVIARLEKEIGTRINPREFTYQTLGQMAASLEKMSVHESNGGSARKKENILSSVIKSISRIVKRS